METFEEQIIGEVKSAILQQIKDCRYIEYHHSKKKNVPENIIEKAWDSINWNDVINNVKIELQKTICATIVQNVLTEAKTDVKKILSIQGVRQKLKVEAYPKIMKVLEETEEYYGNSHR